MTLKVLILSFTLAISKISAECLLSQDTCEFSLTVEERLTMTWTNIRVKAINGTLYRFNENSSDIITKVPIDEVITLDGIQRSVTTVNNRIPGTPIIVYEGQQIVVHVKNKLLNEAVTIHWHGIHQRDTSFMDGVAFVTQCPISPGQSFTYRFKASPRGTFFYHSHIDGQRVDGLFGALIIKPKVNTDAPKDLIMHVGDWFHEQGSELHAKMIYGNFKSQPGFIHPKTLDGVYFAPLIFKSAHIEGRGRYRDPTTGEWTGTPLKEYNVLSGKQYRFRVIGCGMIYPLRISIDNHILMAVASDGFDFQSKNFESVIINPGERFDFIITANQSVDNYWIRADSMEVGFPHNYARAILRYDNHSTEEPNTSRMKCTSTDPCMVLNCQFSYFPKHENSICVMVDQLDGKDVELTPTFDDDSEELFINYIQAKGGMVVNGKKFEHASLSSLTQAEFINRDKTLSCDKSECSEYMEKVCSCHNEIKIPFNKTIQMVWTNHGPGATRHHPIHLHGHSFHVLKIGYANYNETTGLQLQDNDEIECIGSKCYNTKWKDTGRRGDKVPGLKMKNAPQKDTLMIPTGAYAVIRFRSDNPGKWLMHCHIEFHAMQGMSVIINEAPKKHIKPPRGFPVCHDFLNDAKRDLYYEISENEDKNWAFIGVTDVVHILFFILLGIFILENIIMIGCCVCRKKQQRSPSEGNEMRDMKT